MIVSAVLSSQLLSSSCVPVGSILQLVGHLRGEFNSLWTFWLHLEFPRSEFSPGAYWSPHVIALNHSHDTIYAFIA